MGGHTSDVDIANLPEFNINVLSVFRGIDFRNY